MQLRVALLGLVVTATLFLLLGTRQQVAINKPGHPVDVSVSTGHKAESYTGWKLADDEFKTQVDPKKARVVFYIMVAGPNELSGLDALFRNLYHVDHFFLVHLDDKAAANARRDVKSRIQRVLEERGNGQPNVRFVEPGMPITWGGFTMTLNAVYGLTQALHWNSKWDYFVNLSASDLPLLSTGEIAGILGEHKAANTSFITGFKYEPSWEGYRFVDRREMFAEDEAIMRQTRGKKWPWAILDAENEMLMRPMPNMFTVHKGEFWVMLHRSMAEYVHRSPDNQARTLLAYFSGMMVSDEEYFQTVACNPHFPHDTLRTHNDNLRFVNWWGDQASPAVVPPFRAVAAANSGALFARKFSSSTDEGRKGIRWLESYLLDTSRSTARVDRVKRRLAARMGPAGEPVGFCGKRQEKNPPEPYFAVQGEEERLPPEFQTPPPRRGGGGRAAGGEAEWESGDWTDLGKVAGSDVPRAAAADEGRRRERRLVDEVLISSTEARAVGMPGEWRLGAVDGAEPLMSRMRHSDEGPHVSIASTEGAGPSLEGEVGLGVGGNTGRRRRRQWRRRRRLVGRAREGGVGPDGVLSDPGDGRTRRRPFGGT